MPFTEIREVRRRDLLILFAASASAQACRDESPRAPVFGFGELEMLE